MTPLQAGERDSRDRARLLALLHRLRLRRIALTAQPDPHASRSYCTRLLAVDAEAAALHLDALHPEPAPELQAGHALHLRGRLDGGLLRFECRFTGLAIDDHGPVLRAALPERIELLEQRALRRLTLHAAPQGPTLDLEHAGGHSAAHLLDLSAQGAGALAPIDATTPVGSTLRCRFETPTALRIDAEVRSRSVRGAWQRLGLRFTRLRRDEEERLIAALLRLERHAIRRRPALA
ncbi:MAG TPA: PilZ domain-containing protein [Solimonas sp.]